MRQFISAIFTRLRRRGFAHRSFMAGGTGGGRRPPNRTGFIERWEAIQDALADIPGEEGIRRRAEAYAPYFARFGREVRIDRGCRFYHPDRITLDDDVRINVESLLYGSGTLTIGRHARIGPRCFFHSANHETDASGLAFFERRYEYVATRIGDNCLISANVSVLPGAELGNGSFVACGAVVARGSYSQESRLYGVPAKNKASATARGDLETPTAVHLAVVVPGPGRYEQAARLLLTCLGLPQAGIFAAGNALPDTVRATLAFGPPGWAPEAVRGTLWRLVDSGPHFSVGAPDEARDDQITSDLLPAALIHTLIPAPDPQQDVATGILTQTSHTCLERIRKAVTERPSGERLGEFVLRRVVALFPPASVTGVWESCIDMAGGVAHSKRPAANSIEQLRADLCRRLMNPSDDAGVLTGKTLAVARQALSASPRTAPTEPELQLLALCRPETATEDLGWFWVLAQLSGDEAAACRVESLLFATERLDRETMRLWSHPRDRRYCESPVLIAALLLARWRRGGRTLPAIEYRLRRPMAWHLVEAPAGRLDQADPAAALVCPRRRLISTSLLENWLLCLSPPEIGSARYVASEQDYRPVVSLLENVWLRTFARMAHERGLPLVRLRPWPGPYEFAVSLRHVVDRSVQAPHVSQLLEIQRTRLHAACGSWYFSRGTQQAAAIKAALSSQSQELVFLSPPERDGDLDTAVASVEKFERVETWRGAGTVRGAERANAAYVDFRSSQFGFPRPCWLPLAEGPRIAYVWSTPIPFPLESPPDDATSRHFDRLRDRMREQIRAGGHVIIDGDPEVSREALSTLIEQERLGDGWAATIADVVARCRNVMEHGRIRLSGGSRDGVALVADSSLADVQVEILQPGADEPQRATVQLVAGQPRFIDRLHAAAPADDLGVPQRSVA